MLKFECKKCGKCCEDFGNHGHYLPLFEWEVTELRDIAKNKNVNLNIKPIDVMLDKKSGFAFTFQYGMLNEPCPFLINKSCSIYENRPIACRQFPIGKTHAVSNMINLSNFIHCENFNNREFLEMMSNNAKEIKLRKDYISSKFIETYGDCYDYCLQKDIIEQIMLKTMSSYVGKIAPIKLNESDFNKHEILPFFEYLVKASFMKDKEKEATVDFLKNKDKLLNKRERTDMNSG